MQDNKTLIDIYLKNVYNFYKFQKFKMLLNKNLNKTNLIQDIKMSTNSLKLVKIC